MHWGNVIETETVGVLETRTGIHIRTPGNTRRRQPAERRSEAQEEDTAMTLPLSLAYLLAARTKALPTKQKKTITGRGTQEACLLRFIPGDT